MAPSLPIPTVTTTYEKAFTEAFEEYSDALFRHAFFRTSNREKAVDITQDTFIKAWDYARKGQEIHQWKSFLYHVLNNLIIDEYRRKKDRSLDALFEEDTARAEAYTATPGRDEQEAQVDTALLIEKIRALLPQLPAEQGAVLTLRYVDGLSPKEIAASLGITENTVSVRIHRATKHLQTLCANYQL